MADDDVPPVFLLPLDVDAACKAIDDQATDDVVRRTINPEAVIMGVGSIQLDFRPCWIGIALT